MLDIGKIYPLNDCRPSDRPTTGRPSDNRTLSNKLIIGEQKTTYLVQKKCILWMIINRTNNGIFRIGETVSSDDYRPPNRLITCKPITTIAYSVKEKRISWMIVESPTSKWPGDWQLRTLYNVGEMDPWDDCRPSCRPTVGRLTTQKPATICLV